MKLSKHKSVNEKILRPMLSKLIDKIMSEKSCTCCNIEVNEKKGTEVHCAGCGEWCSTK